MHKSEGCLCMLMPFVLRETERNELQRAIWHKIPREKRRK